MAKRHQQPARDTRGVATVAIRPLVDSDLPTAADLLNRANPDDPPITGDYLAWYFSLAITERPHARLVAEQNGRLAGLAILQAVPGRPQLMLFVDVNPKAAMAAVGGALLEAALARAAPEAAVRVLDVAATLSEKIALLLDHGFVELARRYESVLDLDGFEASAYANSLERLSADGYRFATLAEEDRPELRHALHRLHEIAEQDVPTHIEVEHRTFEAWQRALLEGPAARAESFAVAFRGSEPVAISYVISPSEGVGYIWITGVAREHRGKGVGLAVKAHAMSAAKAIGLREVYTNNDPGNAPMLAINRRMGFRDRPVRIDYLKTLQPASESAVVRDSEQLG